MNTSYLSVSKVLILATFVHCNITMAWIPVDTASGQSNLNPSIVPLYRDYGNSCEEYHIYFNPDNRELLWRIVNSKCVEEVYYQTLPNYVETVSASTFSDSRVYIAGMAKDRRWFIDALTQHGETIWSRKGGEENKDTYPIDIEIKKLLVGDDTKELHVHSIYKGVPRFFILKTINGRSVKISSGRLSRKLLQSVETPTTTSPTTRAIDSLFSVEQAIEGIGVLATLLGIAGVGAAIVKHFRKASNEAKNKKIESEIEKWKLENDRRSNEEKTINKLRHYKFHKEGRLLYSGNPFSHLMEGIPLITGVEPPLMELKSFSREENEKRLKSIEEGLVSVKDSTVVTPHQNALTRHLSYEQIEIELFDAARIGDFLKVEKILDGFPWLIHSTDQKGNSLLHHAIISGGGFIDHIIRHGGIINTPNEEGFTPLILSSFYGSLSTFRSLLLSQPHLNIVDISLIFHILARSEHEEMHHDAYYKFKLLLEIMNENENLLGFPTDLWHLPESQKITQSENNLTVLHEAVISGNAGLVALILDENVITNTDEIDGSGNTPLHYAVLNNFNKDGEVIKLLIKHGANLTKKNLLGNTPLHNAIYRGDLEIIKELVSHLNTGDIDVENNIGLTPFIYASLIDAHTEIITLLRGLNPKLVNSSGRTVFHLMCNHSIDIYEKLLESFIDKIDINHQDYQGNTAMHLAVINGNIEAIQAFASKGALVDKPNKRRMTPRDLAEQSFSKKVREIVKGIEQGAHYQETNFAQ